MITEILIISSDLKHANTLGKSDEISLKISRVIIKQFNKKEDFEIEGITFERGDEYASFDLYCSFIKEEDYNEPFSISAEADAETLEIEITYDPKAFPKNMKDLVAEVKETVEHELEHIEQQNFEDMDVNDEFEYEEDDFFEYCITHCTSYPSFLIISFILSKPSNPKTAFKKEIKISFLPSLPNIFLNATSFFTSTNSIL